MPNEAVRTRGLAGLGPSLRFLVFFRWLPEDFKDGISTSFPIWNLWISGIKGRLRNHPGKPLSTCDFSHDNHPWLEKLETSAISQFLGPSKIEVDLVIYVGLSSWSFEICLFLTNPLRDTLNSNCENCGRIWAVVGSDYIWPSDSLHEGGSGVGNPQIEESSAVSQALRSLSKMLDVQTDCSNLAQLPNLHFVSAPQTGACLLAGSVFTVLLCFTLSVTISHRNLSSAEVGWGHAHFLTSLCLHHEGQAATPQGGAQTRRRGRKRRVPRRRAAGGDGDGVGEAKHLPGPGGVLLGGRVQVKIDQVSMFAHKTWREGLGYFP